VQSSAVLSLQTERQARRWSQRDGRKQQIRRREGPGVTHGRTARDRGERERGRTRWRPSPTRCARWRSRDGEVRAVTSPSRARKTPVRLSFLTTPFPLPPLLSPRRMHAGRAVGHPREPEPPGAAVRYAEGRRVRAFAAPRARRRAVVSQGEAGAGRGGIGRRCPDRGATRARREGRAQESRRERLRRAFAVRPRARPPSRPRSVPPRARSKNSPSPSRHDPTPDAPGGKAHFESRLSQIFSLPRVCPCVRVRSSLTQKCTVFDTAGPAPPPSLALTLV
jgi:hypothetical protein